MTGTSLAIGTLPMLLLLYTCVATLDVCLGALTRIELKKLALKEGRRSLENVVHFLEVHQDVSIALHLSRQLLLILLVLTTHYACISSRIPHPHLLSLGVLTVLMLIFGQIVPRSFAYRHPGEAIRYIAPTFQRFYFLLFPLVYPVRLLKNIWTREAVEPQEVGDEEISAFITVGKEEGILEEGEEKLFRSVVDFGDTLVREVMTPRIDIVAVREDATIADLRRVVVEEKHSRIPVHTGVVDNISGFILARDLVHMLSVPEGGAGIKPLIRQPYYVPETKKVSELLQEFQKSRFSMAIVVNEYGGVAGLVTIEDLLEEIVGEIKDEYDDDRDPFVGDEARGFVTRGNTELSAVCEFFKVELADPSVDANTIGGLMAALAGKMPAEGEVIVHRGLRLEVLQGDRRKIQKVRIRKLPKE